MNTDTIIDLTAATDSIPVVDNTKLKVIAELDDQWLGVWTATMTKSDYEKFITNEDVKSVKLHIIGEFDEGDDERIAELDVKESLWIHEFIVNCTRKLRTGEWEYPEEQQTSQHRSVYAALIFGGKQHYVRCKVGVYRALREAIVDFMITEPELTAKQREAKLRELDNEGIRGLYQILATSGNGIYIRLCDDDEMLTPLQLDLFEVMSNVSAVRADFAPIVNTFSEYITKYTSFSISLSTSSFDTNIHNTPAHNNTPISASLSASLSASCDSDAKSESECSDKCNDSDCDKYESTSESDSFDEIEQISNHGYQFIDVNDNASASQVIRHRKGAYTVFKPAVQPRFDNIRSSVCIGAGTDILVITTLIMVVIIIISLLGHIFA